MKVSAMLIKKDGSFFLRASVDGETVSEKEVKPDRMTQYSSATAFAIFDEVEV